jgi:SAM-dependent methyltransferase
MLRPLKRIARNVLDKTECGSRWLWERDYGIQLGTPSGKPEAPWHNAVLLSRAESEAVVAQVTRLGLPVMQDHPKNWDSLAALDLIVKKLTPEAKILDAGSEKYSMILPWLTMYGYRDLCGCNLVFDKPSRAGAIRYEYGDITATKYPDHAFDAVTCLSVIEHGVDIKAYFREMARIIKPGGVLITSTDYYETPIDTSQRSAYGVPIRIFHKADMLEAFAYAKECGFELSAPIDLAAKEKVVHWERHGLSYTFIVFSMIRRANAAATAR